MSKPRRKALARLQSRVSMFVEAAKPCLAPSDTALVPSTRVVLEVTGAQILALAAALSGSAVEAGSEYAEVAQEILDGGGRGSYVPEHLEALARHYLGAPSGRVERLPTEEAGE